MANSRFFVIQEPAGKHPKMEDPGGNSAPTPLRGMSLFLTRKLRVIMATLTSPVIVSYVNGWNPQRNCVFHYLIIDSATIYTASENSNDEFAA